MDVQAQCGAAALVLGVGMRQAARKSMSVLSVLALVSGCATNAPSAAKSELSEAAKTCSARSWPDTVSQMACLDSVEAPIIQARLPSAVSSFSTFSAKRRYLAQQADILNAKGVEAAKTYRVGRDAAFAVLKSNEPKMGDTNSTLFKEWVGAKAPASCKQMAATERAGCIGDILRPIWLRNAPDTIDAFDSFNQKNIALSRAVDAEASPESVKRAQDYFTQGIRQALGEWHDNAQRDIQTANQQDAAARAQALQAFGNFLSGVAEVTLAVAQAQAQQPTPTSCVSQRMGNTVFTNCN